MVPTSTTILVTVSVPAATFARTSMDPATAPGFTGLFRPAPLSVIDWIDAVAGTVCAAAETATEAQPFLFASTVDAAQIASVASLPSETSAGEGK